MYTNRYINIQTFIVTVLLFSGFQFCIWLVKEYPEEVSPEKLVEEKMEQNTTALEGKDTQKEKVIHAKVQEELNSWKVEIPKINLIAGIQEGVSSDILSQSVGHFEETPKTEGNIGLAAHNRGYRMNFFENIKKLEIGDKIIYTYEEATREYQVETLVIIKETDWSYLQETGDNRITLITCIKDSPEYRLCVQGKQM